MLGFHFFDGFDDTFKPDNDILLILSMANGMMS